MTGKYCNVCGQAVKKGTYFSLKYETYIQNPEYRYVHRGECLERMRA